MNVENSKAEEPARDPVVSAIMTEAEIASGERIDVQVRVKPHPSFPAIFQVTLEDGAHRLATKSLAPGRSVYGERLIRFEGAEYRVQEQTGWCNFEGTADGTSSAKLPRTVFGRRFRNHAQPHQRHNRRRRSRLLHRVCSA